MKELWQEQHKNTQGQHTPESVQIGIFLVKDLQDPGVCVSTVCVLGWL